MNSPRFLLHSLRNDNYGSHATHSRNSEQQTIIIKNMLNSRDFLRVRFRNAVWEIPRPQFLIFGRFPMEPFLVTLEGPLVPISRYLCPPWGLYSSLFSASIRYWTAIKCNYLQLSAIKRCCNCQSSYQGSPN